MKTAVLLVISILALASCASTPPANPIVSVTIELPQSTNWLQITNDTDGTNYIREWVPVGSSEENTSWIIVEQKLGLDSPASAKQFIKRIFTLARSACTDIRYNGPDELNVAGHKTYAGRYMCAQQHGKQYGTFTDQRVAAQGNNVYIVTSELRIPGSAIAGMVEFNEEQIGDSQDFLERQNTSSVFIRESVQVCTSATPDC